MRLISKVPKFIQKIHNASQEDWEKSLEFIKDASNRITAGENLYEWMNGLTGARGEVNSFGIHSSSSLHSVRPFPWVAIYRSESEYGGISFSLDIETSEGDERVLSERYFD